MQYKKCATELDVWNKGKLINKNYELCISHIVKYCNVFLPYQLPRREGQSLR